MRVAISGANGFVGRYLCQYLSSRQYSVTAITRKAFSLPGVENRLIADFTDIKSAQQPLAGCDCLVHLAGLAHAKKASIKDYYRINVDQSLAMATAAANAGIKRFIYISSVKVNGETTGLQPFRPSDPAQPEDDYGRSKWQAEQALTEFCKTRGVELIIIRPPLIWGNNNKGNLAKLEKAVSLHLPLPLAAIDNRRDIVSLENLSSLITHCLSIAVPNNPVLLVSDGKALSTTQIIELLARRMNKKVLLFRLPQSLITLFKMKKLHQRLFANLEIDIENTIQVTNWRPITYNHGIPE